MIVACEDEGKKIVLPEDTDSEQHNDADVSDTSDTADTDADTGDTSDTDADTGAADANCDSDNAGKVCTTDEECGACMICVEGGTCAKGCISDEDCKMAENLKCNRKLARCVNAFASGDACSEANCQSGCCYAEKGLSGVKCLASADVTKCGLCKLGEIYSPDEAKCIIPVCSTTTDNCPTLNEGATGLSAKCYECVATDGFVCRPNSYGSGCSAGAVINMKKCIPSGQQCTEGVSECCSGTPCVEGYCY